MIVRYDEPGVVIVTRERERDGAEFYRAYCGTCRRYVHKSPGMRDLGHARADGRQHVALFHSTER